MSADFWTSIKMKGTEQELLSLLKVIRMYAVDKREQYRSERNCAYLNGAYIGKIGGARVDELSDDELLDSIKEFNGQIRIEASGPYGRFGFLEEVSLFEEMADVAPTSWFEGVMSGFDAGGDQSLEVVFENGKVFKSSSVYDYDDYVDEYTYINDVDPIIEDILPYNVFCEAFKIDQDSFDEDNYDDFRMDLICYESFPFDCPWKSFMEYIKCSSIKEAEYKILCQHYSALLKKELPRNWK